MINQSGNACLTDFGLLTISDSTTTSSLEQGGSAQWMSPELFDPESFGLEASRRTVSSDCYALGMVTYEVLSGSIPFAGYPRYCVGPKVLRGERPKRPQGVEGGGFTDDTWGALERCWKPEPSDRPSIDYVLQSLEKASKSWVPFSCPVIVGPQVADSVLWTTASDLNV